MRILIATTNPAKDERLRRCLSDWPFDFSGVESLLDVEPPEESGRNHREVAESKAAAWSRAAGDLAIASDGGMDIPVLGDRWDSLMTHRSAGESASDEDRVENLLRLMTPFDGDDRRAVWRETVVVAAHGVVVNAWEVEGPIGVIQRAPSPTRIEGFWAASLWYFPEVGKTYTELSAEELRRVGDPWTRLTDVIQDWLRDGGWETLTEG